MQTTNKLVATFVTKIPLIGISESLKVSRYKVNELRIRAIACSPSDDGSFERSEKL